MGKTVRYQGGDKSQFVNKKQAVKKQKKVLRQSHRNKYQGEL